MKLKGLKDQKLMDPNFLENKQKFYIKKLLKISEKTGFFGFCQKIIPYMFHVYSCFTQKWCITVLFVILQKENVWKNLVLKCFQPIRLQCSLIINISGKNQVIS